MCGIVGVIAKTDAAPLLVEGLKRLEYRGYDSAGVATLVDGRIERRRAVGKLSALAQRVAAEPIAGVTGIGHTRWATHGAPNETNAHPHQTGRTAVVHNGIIENFRELRTELEAAGRAFATDTDTETVAQLCDWHLARGLPPADAVAATLKRLRGAFALCFVFDGAEDFLICARQGSPLAIGYGDGEMFVGSDALALAPMTDRICYLAEGDWACVTRDGAQIFDRDDRPANREVRTVSIASQMVDKGGYRHFMLKEIHEQPAVVGGAIGRHRETLAQSLAHVDFAAATRLTMSACGTAFYACAVAKYWFESLARLPVEIDIASEFRYRAPPLPPGGAAVFVSQSGETADTLAALRYCRDADQQIVAVVNAPESTIAREADAVLRTFAGPEIGVASTKAFTCQLAVLATMAAQAARARGYAAAADDALAQLNEVPRLLAEVLAGESAYPALCHDLAKARDILYLGRGTMQALALEGALKLKEISYIHAEGYAAGELKHGPIALIDENTPVIVMAPRDALFEKTVSNMQEVMARGGKVLLISDAAGLAEAGQGAWRTLELPTCGPVAAPIVYAAAAQLLAYYTAVDKGTDVDQPRNLAKSVTVE